METLKVKQTIWDLTPLFKNDNDPQITKKRKALQKESCRFANKWRKRTDYLKNTKTLEQALGEYEKWARFYGYGGDEWYYFHLRSAQNQVNPRLRAKFNQIDEISTKILNNIQFFDLNLAKIPKKLQKKFLVSKELKKYKHFLERLFAQSPYLLSDPEEKILNLKASTSYENWVRMLNSFLAKEKKEVSVENGKKKVKNFSEILTLINSQNKKVRDSAAQIFNEILRKHLDAAEAELNSVFHHKKTNDELRQMPRPDLSRHLSDDLDSETVDTLVDTVTERFDISKNYYKLKAKLFGIKKLEYHERNVEYGKLDKKYSYKKAVELIYKVCADLDEEFAQIFKAFVENGRVDIYPKKGKASGCFCAYNLITQPVYLFLNYTNKLRDVVEFAHELGHGINGELMRQKQNALTFSTPLSTAEVASTFMEDFILEEILKKADDRLKLSLMMHKLNSDVSTIFRQAAFNKFEYELHKLFRQKGYLAKEEIGKLFQKHMASYMGSSVEQSPGSENWWLYVDHFRAFFYNYQYAMGLLISKALQALVKKDSKFIKKVKEFMAAGSSDSPKNIFKKFGIDITNKKFYQQGLAEVENLLRETTALAKKLNKI